MNKIIGKSWRDAASLIVLTKRNNESLSQSGSQGGVNYDILLQTRTRKASFANAIVFPGGVNEPADRVDRWLDLLKSYGYTQKDFAVLHHPGSVITPVFKQNPLHRHIELRIAAIRETFEELGLLICSCKRKEDRSGPWADTVLDIDVKHWQKLIYNNPEELYNLCKEYNCYPDIWSVYYWSNWLTPLKLPNRFDTVFFVTALQSKPHIVESNSEVLKVQWSSPLDVLNKSDIILFPPQIYELYRLACVTDIEKLIRYAKERSAYGTELLCPLMVRAKDGILHILPGDDLYSSGVEDIDNIINYKDKTVLQLREICKTLHRFETSDLNDTKKTTLIIKNYTIANHINMGDVVLQVQFQV